MNAIAFFSITIIPQVVHGMLVRVIPEINPNHASNLFYVKENYLAYAQSPETGNVYIRSGMDARLLHSREFSKKILDDTKITGSNFCIKGLGVGKTTLRK